MKWCHGWCSKCWKFKCLKNVCFRLKFKWKTMLLLQLWENITQIMLAKFRAIDANYWQKWGQTFDLCSYDFLLWSWLGAAAEFGTRGRATVEFRRRGSPVAARLGDEQRGARRRTETQKGRRVEAADGDRRKQENIRGIVRKNFIGILLKLSQVSIQNFHPYPFWNHLWCQYV